MVILLRQPQEMNTACVEKLLKFLNNVNDPNTEIIYY